MYLRELTAWRGVRIHSDSQGGRAGEAGRQGIFKAVTSRASTGGGSAAAQQRAMVVWSRERAMVRWDRLP